MPQPGAAPVWEDSLQSSRFRQFGKCLLCFDNKRASVGDDAARQVQPTSE